MYTVAERRIFAEICQRVTADFLRDMPWSPRHPPAAWDINNGRCDEWADEVTREAEAQGLSTSLLWLEDVEGLEHACHIVVVFDGRYYDAECPTGVDSPYDLPIVLNGGKSREEVLAEQRGV